MCKPAILCVATCVSQLAFCSFLWASEPPLLTAEDVPWQLADQRTVLLLRLEPHRVTGPELQAAAKAVLGPGAEQLRPQLEQAQAWLERFDRAGVERIYIGLSAPVDGDGEESDPPAWAAAHHRPGAADAVSQVISEFGRAMGSQLSVKPANGRWVAVSEAGREPALGLAREQRVDLQLAMGPARGTALSAALAPPPAMRAQIARFLGEMGEADPGIRPIFKRLSTSAEHWRYATGGLWLGERPTVRIEFVFDDPQGPIDLADALEQLRAVLAKLAQAAPADPPSWRQTLEAAHDLCRVRHLDRTAVWEVEPERAPLLGPLLRWVLPAHIAAEDR